MTSERGGLLKSRAEDFARHLTRRLRSLGGAGDGGGGSWVESSTEVYYDIDSSLASPQEELAEPIFIASQNKDGLPLQRSESSGSEYFDTFEELPQPSSSALLKKIPILHLKTEKPVPLTNGHTNVIDADLGCTRVHVISCEEIQPSETIAEKETCDIVENNNTWIDVEDVDKIDKKEAEPVLELCNGAVSLETHLVCAGNTSDKTDSETLGNCVFCDIEQAKSTFTSNTESIVPQIEDQRISSSINHSADKEPDKHKDSHIEFSHQKPNGYLPETEDSVSLSDLLQVLKREISKDSECTEEAKNLVADSKTSDDPQTTCPSIEVRESTPTQSQEVAEKDEEFDIETKRKNFRRCSSLKSGKTPPGTPGRKKIVRFADVLGLDLTDTKTFQDEVPTVPSSAYSDLHLPDDVPSSQATSSVMTPQTQKVLVPLFPQPFLSPNFMDRVMANNVCLESAAVSDMNLFAITGVVRVRNIDFHKSVYIRYSINSWKNYADLQARYIPKSCDGFSDKFSFVLYAHTLSVGQKMEFAVRYHTAGTQFWDSNGGLNYVFECLQQPVPIAHPEIPPSPVETWASFL
ncbi:glycogen-binding subunit 76A-like [Macrosteles quadrilineatus]|uniref:glycogen-binding subunit 76A-like n=1 Tax=Macrosteles quadrilineatus TaxID=74068 RepID=UPI0023E1EB59|nr:glycogen-binding subunit 76A-like [Macrosteles quadrilineatus]